jgi:hypothetical protein
LGKEHPHLPASLLYSPEELAILEVYKKKAKASHLPPAAGPQPSEPVISQEALDQIQVEIRAYQKTSGLALPEASMNVWAPASSPAKSSGTSNMTLWEANRLTAQLAGFWGRKGDGHPGPDVLARGLLILAELVGYERIKKAQQLSSADNPCRKPG